MKKLLALLPDSMILPIFIIGGVLAGLGAYAIYMSRPHSYLSDNPAACVNCHIMTPYYQSWNHSSHAAWATCNDCHIPHDNLVHTYGFKAMDGLYHAAVFTFRAEPQTIRIERRIILHIPSRLSDSAPVVVFHTCGGFTVVCGRTIPPLRHPLPSARRV